MQATTKTPRTGFTAIRFPDELKAWLKQQAEANRRTMASEVIYRLEREREQELTETQEGGDATS